MIVDVAIFGKLRRLRGYKNKPSPHILFSFHPASKHGPVLTSVSALSVVTPFQEIARWKLGMAFGLPFAAYTRKQEEG